MKKPVKKRELPSKLSLRLQPTLRECLERDAIGRGEGMSDAARAALEEHYLGEPPIEKLRQEIRLLRHEIEEIARDIALSTCELLYSTEKFTAEEATARVKQVLKR